MKDKETKKEDGQPTIADLSMLVARLIQQVRKHEPENDVAEKAMDYLRRKDLAGSILREKKKDKFISSGGVRWKLQ